MPKKIIILNSVGEQLTLTKFFRPFTLPAKTVIGFYSFIFADQPMRCDPTDEDPEEKVTYPQI